MMGSSLLAHLTELPKELDGIMAVNALSKKDSGTNVCLQKQCQVCLLLITDLHPEIQSCLLFAPNISLSWVCFTLYHFWKVDGIAIISFHRQESRGPER